MADVKVGKVSHYYDHVSVAVVDLTKKLKVGDKIKFVKGKEELFQQTVASIEYEHKKLDSAGKGKSIGLQVDKKVKDGTEVYKVE